MAGTSLPIGQVVRLQRTSADFAEFCVTHVANPQYSYLFLASAPGRADYEAELARQTAAEAAALEVHDAVTTEFGGVEGLRAAVAGGGGAPSPAVRPAASKRSRSPSSDDGTAGHRARQLEAREREEAERRAILGPALEVPPAPGVGPGEFVGPHAAHPFPAGSESAEQLQRHVAAVVAAAKERSDQGAASSSSPASGGPRPMQEVIAGAASFIAAHRTRTEAALHTLLGTMAGSKGEAVVGTARLALFFVAAGVVFQHCSDGPLWTAAQRSAVAALLRGDTPAPAAPSAPPGPEDATLLPYQSVFDEYLPRIVAHALRGRPAPSADPAPSHALELARTQNAGDVAAVTSHAERWATSGLLSPAAVAQLRSVCQLWSAAGAPTKADHL